MDTETLKQYSEWVDDGEKTSDERNNKIVRLTCDPGQTKLYKLRKICGELVWLSVETTQQGGLMPLINNSKARQFDRDVALRIHYSQVILVE